MHYLYYLPHLNNEKQKGDLIEMSDLNEKVIKLMEMYDTLEGDYPPNIWDIVEYGNESYETRYSKFLSWLLNPRVKNIAGSKAKHNAGTFFAEKLLSKYLNKQVSLSKNFDYFYVKPEESFPFNCEGRDCKKPCDKKKRKIDVLFLDKTAEKYILIELKMGSNVHSCQLKKYADYADEKYSDYEGLLLFLTPNGGEAKEKEWDTRWTCVKYEDLNDPLHELIGDIYKRDQPNCDHTRKLIHDFLYDMKRYASKEQFKDMVSKKELTDDEYASLENVIIQIQQETSASYKENFLKRIDDDRRGQNHDPLEEGQLLIRKIFNEIAESKNGKDAIPVNNSDNFGEETDEQRSSVANKDYQKLGIRAIRLKTGKGQGLEVYLKDDLKTHIYMSVDCYNIFPNDLGLHAIYKDCICRNDGKKCDGYCAMGFKLKKLEGNNLEKKIDNNEQFSDEQRNRIKDIVRKLIKLNNEAKEIPIEKRFDNNGELSNELKEKIKDVIRESVSLHKEVNKK